jgi:FAD/FMN-containing dehydrogenase
MTDTPGTTGWRNWSGTVECRPARVTRAGSEAEVVRVIEDASRAGERVRVVGAGHSGTPLCATEGVMLDLEDLAGVESHDAIDCTASIRAGTRLCNLGDPLLERGLAMENLGDIDKQALGGAIGTGTHGTGRALGNLSTQVEAVRFVDGRGEISEVSAVGDADTLRGLRVGLGALGVLTSIRLRLLPAYRLHEKITRGPTEECLERLDERVQANRHFEFFWMPFNDLAEMKSLNPTDAPPNELPDEPYERIGWSPHIITSERDIKFFEMEYSIPAEHGPACFRAVRARMQERHASVMWPVEYRTVAADDAFLSPAFGRETVTLSVHQDGTLPYREFFEDLEPIFREFEGRPHWGKIHSLGASRLRELYPAWDAFAELRDRLDPERRFANAYLEQLLGA